ncbi:hypothetical protein CHS0354_035571 [Potamilus streckersoni]|uniref:Uncharacterized protein n=1 Tax=Potamilus streckersoni TaxID=2493646 RepID=A0AAE0VIB1_9BIVA|nr:hypothetical protein CHS0354_035571 [Potamilus streckersoni]
MRLLIAALACALVVLVLAENCPHGVHDCTLTCWSNQTLKCENHICTCETLHNTGKACSSKTDCTGTNNPEPLRCNDHQVHCVDNTCHCAHHGNNHFNGGGK